MLEEYNEQEVSSDDTQKQEEQSSKKEEQSSENGEQETSQQNPEELKKRINELEGQKNYYQSQYKKVKESAGSEKSDNVPTRDEMFLIAQGYSEEDLAQLNVIAKGKGISLKEAKKDLLFTSYKGQTQAEETKSKAQLGASGGSPQTQTGTSRDDLKSKHEELMKKYQG